MCPGMPGSVMVDFMRRAGRMAGSTTVQVVDAPAGEFGGVELVCRMLREAGAQAVRRR